jgi:hypothetical protein
MLLPVVFRKFFLSPAQGERKFFLHNFMLWE